LQNALSNFANDDPGPGAGRRAVERIEEIEAIARATESQCRTWQWLKNFTALGVGGPVAAIVYPSTVAGAARLVDLLDRAGLRWRALGHGTSILAADEVHNYVAISLRLLDERLVFEGDSVWAHAGYSLPALVRGAAERGLSGLEGLAGVAGGLGGALRTGAGTPGYDIWRVVEKVTLAEGGEVRTRPEPDAVLELDPAAFTDGDLILAAMLRLAPGDPEEIRAEMARQAGACQTARPVGLGGAGRIFKDSGAHAAAHLIDQLGFRGKSCGGARVSETHAEFIVNEGNATAEDVFGLSDQIRERARRERGLELEYGIDVWKDEGES